MGENTTIMLSKHLKKKLDNLKEHRREPYYEVIKRLLDQRESVL